MQQPDRLMSREGSKEKQNKSCSGEKGKNYQIAKRNSDQRKGGAEPYYTPKKLQGSKSMYSIDGNVTMPCRAVQQYNGSLRKDMALAT